MQQIWINGVEGEWLDVRDRGVAYGDGLFETIQVSGGRVRLLQPHWSRLAEGARRLGFPEEAVNRLQEDLLRIALPEQAVLKLLLTRGQGGRGYSFSAAGAPTRVIMLLPWPGYANQAEQGIRARRCALRLGLNPALAGIKHLNRLEQVLARNEWQDPAISEGLLCDCEGYLVEGTMSNLFWVKSGRVYTPRLDRCGVAGVVRSRLIQYLAEMGRPATEGLYRFFELRQAEEVFVCNSLIDIWPVVVLEDQTYPVGPVTRALQRRLQEEYRL